MKTPSLIQRSILCLLLVVATNLATAAPRPPILPFPELTLKSWKFDYPELVTAEGLGAHIATNLWLAESWSGYSLNMTASGALLLTPAVKGYYSNIKSGSGTIRLWFAPNWSSASAGGSGPGDWATLFELAQTNTVTNPFGFALAIDPAGTNLVAAVNTTTGAFNLVQYPINWATGVWHQIAFVYWTEGVALMVDDSPEQSAATVPPWPTSSVWNQSAFSLGSAFDASQLAQGQLDEIHTFGYALPTNYLTWTYQLYAPIAALGPLSEEEWGAQTSSMSPPCDPCPPGDTNSEPKNLESKIATNGFRFAAIPYITNGTSYVTKLLDTGSSSRAYQVFQTLQLQSIPSNTVWTLAANGGLGVTNFNLSFSTNTTNASFLAARVTDYDGDGFSDAFETLVSPKTDPKVFNDTNGDGLSENFFSIAFEFQNRLQTNGTDVRGPQGNLIRGKGFRVWADSGSTYSTLRFYFESMYRGLPLNIFTTVDDYPDANEVQVAEYVLPAPDNTFHKYLINYDFRTFRLIVSNSASNLLTNIVVWRDNVMDALGTNGPSSLVLSNGGQMANSIVTNFSFTPAQFAPASRYVWEGVIGNTSQNPSGPTAHSGFWPIKKMVSKGSNVFYTCGFNEGGLDILRFNTNNHQIVNTNFGSNGRRVQDGSTYPIDMAYKDATNLYVLYTNKATSNLWVSSYDVNTCVSNGAPALSQFPAAPVNTNVPTANGVLAVHPDDSSIVAVYYTNAAQVVVYTNANSPTGKGTNFVIGVRNGYSNGPSILIPTNTATFRTNLKLDPHYFESNSEKAIDAALCFQSDGKLWVGDAITARMLRFDTSGLCDAWFMYVPHSYCGFADPNDPSRVFNQYLEFRVDYSQPLQTGWVLTNYWGKLSSAGRPDVFRGAGAVNHGLFHVTTLTNNTGKHTFALVAHSAVASTRRIAELTSDGVRIVGTGSTTDLDARTQLESNGSMLYIPLHFTTATLLESHITNWSGNDPLYSLRTNGSISFSTNNDPINFNYKLAENKAFTFQKDFKKLNTLDATYTASQVFAGFHLGAITNLNATNSGTWKWTNAPTGPLNGRGNFDSNIRWDGHAANIHTVVGTNVFFGFQGEFWLNGGRQANQFFHYSTAGDFLGQFGLPHESGLWTPNFPHDAGNPQNFSVVATNGVLYLYAPDESSHGLSRWRVEP